MKDRGRKTRARSRRARAGSLASFVDDPAAFSVAVIGGGYAGMSAALELARAGVPVSVFEGGPRLGGRARRIDRRGMVLDNGQHILLGAYRESLRLIALAGGAPEAGLRRTPLRLAVKDGVDLAAARVPAPWHLLLGLARAHGLTLMQRWRAVRFMSALRLAKFRLGRDATVRELLRHYRQDGALAAQLWEPLCVAALNTPAEEASAQMFLHVLRDAFHARREDSDLLLPTTDLSSLFPEPAAARVRAAGGRVETLAAVDVIGGAPGRFTLHLGERCETFAALILAVGPREAPRLLAGLPGLERVAQAIAALSHQPILTAYMQFASTTRLATPMIGLADGPVQWLFDRGQMYGQQGLIAAVSSAAGRLAALPNDEAGRLVVAEVARRFPDWGAPLWSKVIVERFATFSCVPGALRPGQATPMPGLFLAGDYTAGDYPGTIEGAVRSGVRCARLALGAVTPAKA